MKRSLTQILIFCKLISVSKSPAITFKKKVPTRFGAMEPASDLALDYPKEALCIEISSPYGSPTRYDGSKRPEHRLEANMAG